MTLPRMDGVRVYSLRWSDQPADAGVLPSEHERIRYNITIIPLANTIHEHASEQQREEIGNYVMTFLGE